MFQDVSVFFPATLVYGIRRNISPRMPSVETKQIILNKNSFYFQGNVLEIIDIWETYLGN